MPGGRRDARSGAVAIHSDQGSESARPIASAQTGGTGSSAEASPSAGPISTHAGPDASHFGNGAGACSARETRRRDRDASTRADGETGGNAGRASGQSIFGADSEACFRTGCAERPSDVR